MRPVSRFDADQVGLAPPFEFSKVTRLIGATFPSNARFDRIYCWDTKSQNGTREASRAETAVERKIPRETRETLEQNMEVSKQHFKQQSVAKAIASLHETRPFVVRPIIDHVGLSLGTKPQLGTHRTSAASYLYIRREPGSDSIGPLPPAYLEKRGDLVDTGRAYPRNTPPALREGRLLWDEADSAALRHDLGDASATHIVASLPSAMTPLQWRELVTKWALEALVKEGMIVDWAIHSLHDPDSEKWAVKPHVHALATARDFKPGLRRGRRQFAWLKSSRQVQAAEDIWLRLTDLQPVPITA